MPTDRRKRSGGAGLPAPSIEARCSIRLSTPPSEVARFHTRTRAAAAIAASSPPLTRMLSMPPKPPVHLPRRDRVAGMPGQSRIEHRARHRMRRQRLGDRLRRAAGALDARIERAHAAQQQVGLEAAEDRAAAAARRNEARQNASSRAVVRQPAMTSLWPFRYLVAECMTRSAPSASGRVSTGWRRCCRPQASAPAACAISAAPAMSVTDHRGFAGVSIQTSRVRPGCTAWRNASSEVASTKAAAIAPRPRQNR